MRGEENINIKKNSIPNIVKVQAGLCLDKNQTKQNKTVFKLDRFKQHKLIFLERAKRVTSN